MKKQSMLRLSVIILASVGAISTASAQTSAQTDLQQVQGQPAAATHVAQLQPAGMGEAHSATLGSTHSAVRAPDVQPGQGGNTAPCVGPVSYCTLYFGS